MTRDLPRPPWLRRLPSGVWTALTWCLIAAFALLLFVSTTFRISIHQLPPLAGLALRAGLAVVLAAVLAWGGRRPLIAFGLLVAESVAVPLLGEKTWPLFLAMDVLVGYIATVRSPRTVLAVAGVELAVWSGESAMIDQGFSDFLSELAAVAAGIAIPAMIGNAIRQQRRYGRALREHAAAQAVTTERLRIARELHDMVAHSIGVIAIQAGAAGLVLDTQPAGARKALNTIETTSRETLAGLRRMLVSLREAGEDPAHTVGLEAVERLAETTTAGTDLDVEVEWRGERRPIPPEIDLAAFRIVQEAVTNVVKHSGARHCRVSVDYGQEELTVDIADDGRGSARGSGFGISGMRERVALLDGLFSAGSEPGGGFRVTARLPA
ncbi:sensor histidine kinase [Nonomuraea sp. NPDC050536]|uniref:sensor histidine kinase n=1 Tax=Nonomuraea sp. NPDC050536 TaxID=3364366 RepID=UPI0037CB8B13